MTSIAVDQVSNLPECVDRMTPGDTLALTRDGLVIAELRRTVVPIHTLRRIGFCKTEGYWMADDFNAPLPEFEDSHE